MSAWNLPSLNVDTTSARCLPLLSWRECVAAGAHEEYLGFVGRGAMLEREDAELQRELSHLLAALTQMQPLLRNLQLEVRRQRCHAACERFAYTSAISYAMRSFCLSPLGHLQPLTRSCRLEAGIP